MCDSFSLVKPVILNDSKKNNVALQAALDRIQSRREADDPSWLDGFFQRAQGDCLIGWYARWHPESGLSIPTREQWDDFLEELKSKGVDY